jgi:hypothetical protein
LVCGPECALGGGVVVLALDGGRGLLVHVHGQLSLSSVAVNKSRVFAQRGVPLDLLFFEALTPLGAALPSSPALRAHLGPTGIKPMKTAGVVARLQRQHV